MVFRIRGLCGACWQNELSSREKFQSSHWMTTSRHRKLKTTRCCCTDCQSNYPQKICGGRLSCCYGWGTKNPRAMLARSYPSRSFQSYNLPVTKFDLARVWYHLCLANWTQNHVQVVRKSCSFALPDTPFALVVCALLKVIKEWRQLFRIKLLFSLEKTTEETFVICPFTMLRYLIRPQNTNNDINYNFIYIHIEVLDILLC